MSAENIAIVTDSGCSVRPEHPEARNGVNIVPLEVRFWETDKYVPYSDLTLNPEDFYQRMATSPKTPQTAGALPGSFISAFQRLAQETKSIIALTITAAHSGVYQSAIEAKSVLQPDLPETRIEVVDTKQITAGQWFLAEAAKKLADGGAKFEEIIAYVKEKTPKIELHAVLKTVENLRAGGRAEGIIKAVARVAAAIHVEPILGLKDGVLTFAGTARTPSLARRRLVEMAGDAGPLERIAVIHTHALETAQNIKEGLAKVFKGEIPIFEAGPVLAVHAGEGAVGVAYQKV